MRNESEVREALIRNTIRLIADGGFEKATTRAIASNEHNPSSVKLNEIYIYRLFGSKESLYGETFSILEKELVEATEKVVVEGCRSSYPVKKNMYILFSHLWRFILGNEERCRCYVRYYYSIYYKGDSQKKHNVEFNRLLSPFSFLFKAEADWFSLMHSAFTAMLDFAIRVYNGDILDTEDSTLHIFNVIYNSIASYLVDGDKYRDTIIVD